MSAHTSLRAAAAAYILVAPALAFAQGSATPTAPSSAQRSTATAAPRDHGLELTIGGAWVGGVSFGSTDANLQTPTGSSLTLFSTSSELGAGGGLEAHLGFHVTRKLGVEVSGTWTSAEARTSISSDFEGAEPITATVGTSHFTLEGSALWTITRRGKAEWFVRGGFGWLRDLDESSVLVDDGTIATIGGGVKYWWREQPRGALRKLGLRVEARAAIRSSGISLDDRSTHVQPVLAGGLIIGF